MNGATALMAANRPVDLYPSSDGEPMAESEAHILAMMMLIVLLRQHFRDRHDVFVIGDMFWYYEEGNPAARKAPDLMVVKGVDPSPRGGRKSFKSWEERANPCFALELTSPGTAEEDTDDKLDLYQRLGVHEYFLFDSTANILERPLIGYRLMRGVYEPLIPAADGSLPSNELGIRFVPKGTDLVLIDMRTGRRLEDLPQTTAELENVRTELEFSSREIDRVRRAEDEARQELARQREEVLRVVQQTETEKLRAEAEKLRAEGEKFRADAETLRANTAETEIQRLKALLAAIQKPSQQEGPRP